MTVFNDVTRRARPEQDQETRDKEGNILWQTSYSPKPLASSDGNFYRIKSYKICNGHQLQVLLYKLDILLCHILLSVQIQHRHDRFVQMYRAVMSIKTVGIVLI